MTDHIPADTGTEGPRGHEARPPTDDRKVPWRVFVTVGVAIGFLWLVYWLASYEEAGTVLLLISAVLALWVGIFLWLRRPNVPEAQVEVEAAVDVAEEEHYLPHASVWPFAIGLGGAAVGVGIVLGLWVLVPGLGVLALGLGGFVRQTRRRD